MSISRQPPSVDLQGLSERKLLEAELFRREAQLTSYSGIRDRVTAAGLNADATYRQILSRRDEVASALVKLQPHPPKEKVVTVLQPRLAQSLLDIPIAPAKFIDTLGVFQFGYSGFVQMGRPTDGVYVVPGVKETSGDIVTTSLNDNGYITWDGFISAGADSAAPVQYDPAIQYSWLRNWHYLIPFPVAPYDSTFTYRFDVYVLANVFRDGGDATLWSFVSVGETPNLTTGENIPINRDAGWPLQADLTDPNAGTLHLYNGRYGVIDGRATVQRSFEVRPVKRLASLWLLE